ncbi:MAG: hydroxymethylpyrimidine/phosphomethylpyrimidine kinase [Bacteroidetes bacterium CG23_combo_of_CG06-09_8_20_14_all_32_9]|nr:MAG: hydroxymethylpyrimidine/phosphomethylpyrimidine kinase [Bacteroidetes bacterium CG23_combo_of_CG06-09_8_20_14_all_32_9]
MAEERICVLSIAGFDPSGGAGILADIKTFEAHKVCGMGAMSALTFQNDVEFDNVRWIEADDILKQISMLRKRFEFTVIKIGLVQNIDALEKIIMYFNQKPETRNQNPFLIWDPIIKASAGFEFHKMFDREKTFSVLKNIFLITPNTNEVKFLSGINYPIKAAEELSKYCNVLLKGGHNKKEPGIDYLFMQNKIEKIFPTKTGIFPKHGSGCVLSSAIASNLALGNNLITSCYNAKKYIERFLSSNQTLLGVHYV